MKRYIIYTIVLAWISMGLSAQTSIYLCSNQFAEEVQVMHRSNMAVNETGDSILLPAVDRVVKRALADIDSITFALPEGFLLSYVLEGQGDVNNFNPENKTIGNLTITGSDIVWVQNISATGGLERIKGVLTIDNIGAGNWSLNEVPLFGDLVKCDSSIIVKNCTELNNSNSFGFSSQTVINGDLVLENLPNLPFHWGGDGGFISLTRIKGDLKVLNCALAQSLAFKNLTMVDGSVHLEGAGGNFWDFNEIINLQSIGGDLILINNQVLNSFLGLEHIAVFNGDLIIKDCPRFGSFSNSAMLSVAGDFHIENSGTSVDNEKLYDLASITDLQSIGGDLFLSSNDYMNSLGGLQNLTSIGGNVTITENGNASDQIPVNGLSGSGYPGFCLVKDGMDEGVIGAEASITLSDYEGTAIDVSSLTSCTPPPKYQSFVINDNQEALDFVALDTVMDLSIQGAVWITGFDAIKEKALALTNGKMVVLGELTLQNLTLADDIAGFVNSLQLDSSLIIRNWTNTGNGFNVNSFQGLTGIKGDLIIEDCKVFGFEWGGTTGFRNITTVAGDLILRNENTFNGNGFAGIVSVGGDFIIDNCDGNFWDLGAMTTFTSVGGSIEFTNNGTVNSLGGFHLLTSIGGDVTITGNNAIPLTMAGAYPGFCLIVDQRTAGIISAGAVVTLADKDGVAIPESSLSSCTGL